MTRILDRDDHLFALARRGRWLTNVYLAVVVAWAILFLGDVPAIVLDVLVPGAGSWSTVVARPAAGQALWLVARLWLEFVPMALLAVAWVVWVERRPAVTLGLERPRAGRRYLRGFVVGAGMYLLLTGMATLFADVSRAPAGATNGTTGIAALGAVLLTYAGWTIQGPAEELLARGWLLGSLGARYGPWLGVIVSSAVFASFHVFNAGFGLLPAVNLFLAGAFFALYAVWDGGLWGVFALHAAWNWTQGNVLGLSVSGAPPVGGSLVDLEIGGPAWLVGGTFGLEGGVLDTVVETLGVLGMVYLLWRRRQVPGGPVAPAENTTAGATTDAGLGALPGASVDIPCGLGEPTGELGSPAGPPVGTDARIAEGAGGADGAVE